VLLLTGSVKVACPDAASRIRVFGGTLRTGGAPAPKLHALLRLGLVRLGTSAII